MKRLYFQFRSGGCQLLDRTLSDQDFACDALSLRTEVLGGSPFFWSCKRGFDIGACLILLIVLVPLSVAILILNPFLNRGKLFFFQERMGRNCQPFMAIKFRSMTAATCITRSHDDPIEHERITRLGNFLRRSRIDELPQILNVLKGEMSLIGPRPDYYEHARVFRATIPTYAERHAIRPGISGLAQVDLGYAEGSDATRKKVAKDHYYIHHAGFYQELRLIFATIVTVVTMAGA